MDICKQCGMVMTYESDYEINNNTDSNQCQYCKRYFDDMHEENFKNWLLKQIQNLYNRLTSW